MLHNMLLQSLVLCIEIQKLTSALKDVHLLSLVRKKNRGFVKENSSLGTNTSDRAETPN